MDQPAPKQTFTKPVGGFVVVLCVALFVGAWLYVDMVKNELEMKVETVAADLRAVRAARKAAEEREAPPAPSTATRTYAAGLGDYRFQVDLPVGFHLSVGADADEALVVMDPTPENETPVPDIVIRLVDLKKEPYASKLGKADEPWTRLVPAADGKYGFWITPWEDFAWEGFAAVAASFKAL